MESNPPPSPHRIRRLAGCLERRPRWGLTARGWIAATALLAASATVAVRSLHPFLAVNSPVQGAWLAVEGWVPDYALQAAVEEFRSKPYTAIIATGGPLELGSPLKEFHSFAQVGAEVMSRLGAPGEALHAAPSPEAHRDRTYHSALALRAWLENNPEAGPDDPVTVVTLATHARRTRLLFRMALGERPVGVIAVPSRAYPGRRWWTTSEGFRTVTGELIAWVYARFAFHPSSPDPNRPDAQRAAP